MSKSRTPAPLDLTWEEVGFVCEGLSFAPRAVKNAIDGINEEYSLGPRGAWILMLIAAGPHYPLDITNVFQVGRSLITAELARLTSAALITARQNTADRRRTELALTPAGEAVCLRIRANLSRTIQARLAGYTRDQIMLFAQMLRDARTPCAGEDRPGRRADEG